MWRHTPIKSMSQVHRLKGCQEKRELSSMPNDYLISSMFIIPTNKIMFHYCYKKQSILYCVCLFLFPNVLFPFIFSFEIFKEHYLNSIWDSSNVLLFVAVDVLFFINLSLIYKN